MIRRGAATLPAAGLLIVVWTFWAGWSQADTAIFDGDSFGYVYPGLLAFHGMAWAGSAFRNVGYPLVTLAAVALGGFRVLPVLQLAATAATVAAMLATIAPILRPMRPPAWPWLFGLLGFAAAALLVADDQYALFVSGVRPEAFLSLSAAVALLAMLQAQRHAPGAARVALSAVSTLAAGAATLLKPGASGLLALSAALFLVAMAQGRRDLRRHPGVILACIACAATLAAGFALDAIVLRPGHDFGPRTLFCNHLPAILPTIGTATPERARLSLLLQADLQAGPQQWPVLGYNGDVCFNDRATYDAIEAARRAEGMESSAWLTHQVLRGAAAHPLRYAIVVLRQLRAFATRPFPDIDLGLVQAGMHDEDWRRLRPFEPAIGQSREQLSPRIGNRFAATNPAVVEPARRALHAIGPLFAPVCLAAALLAAIRLAADRSRMPERLLLLLAVFTLAYALPVALAHTFDIARYAAGMMPVTLSLLLASSAYLAITAYNVLRR